MKFLGVNICMGFLYFNKFCKVLSTIELWNLDK